jgi:hypothetical protein
MSIVALKRNSQRYLSKVSHNQGSNGFALNGGLRNAGWVGQTSLGRIGSANSFCVYQDPSIVKKSVKNTLGVLPSTIRYPVSAGCTNGGCDPLHSSMNEGKKAALTDDHTASGQIANVINNAICNNTLCSTSTASTPFGLFTGGPNTLPLLDGIIYTSFISNDGTFGYFGTSKIFKVNLATMTLVTAPNTLALGGGTIWTSFISNDGTIGYFGTQSGNIFKVNLATMALVTAPNTLPPLDGAIRSSFISNDGTIGYFGTDNGSILKVNLATMVLVTAPNTLAIGDGIILTSFISNDGTTGYFGTQGGSIYKVNLATMTLVTAPNTLALGGSFVWTSFISNDGTTGYFGTDNGIILKVNLATMVLVTAPNTLAIGDGTIWTSFISNDGTTGYFGTSGINPTFIGKIFKVDLATMTIINAGGTPLNNGDIYTSFISNDGSTGYFGTTGGNIFKVNLGNDAVAAVCQCNTNRVSVINNPTAFKSKLPCPPAGCRAGSHHINGRFVYDTPYNKDVSSFSAMTAGDYIRRLKKPASFNTQFNNSKTVRPYMLVNLPQGVIGNAATV